MTTIDKIQHVTAITLRCEICDHAIKHDEKYTDDGHEIVHVQCANDWYRRNFGREYL